MHPPLEIVFRECTAADVINKLRGLGCEVNRSKERGAFDPRIDPASDLVTQPLSVQMNGVEPFDGPFLAWRDNSDECSFVYMPQNTPPPLRAKYEKTRATIVASLKSDPAFVRRPGDFTTRSGAGRVLLVFTRIKEDGTASVQDPASVEETKAKIRKLQQERVEVLHQAVKVAHAFYREGVSDFRSVISAQQDLLGAKLDMTETRAEQMEVLASQLKTAKSSLAVAQEMFQAGRTTVLDVHKSRSEILRIEIRLLKMRVLDESNSRQPE